MKPIAYKSLLLAETLNNRIQTLGRCVLICHSMIEPLHGRRTPCVNSIHLQDRANCGCGRVSRKGWFQKWSLFALSSTSRWSGVDLSAFESARKKSLSRSNPFRLLCRIYQRRECHVIVSCNDPSLSNFHKPLHPRSPISFLFFFFFFPLQNRLAPLPAYQIPLHTLLL